MGDIFWEGGGGAKMKRRKFINIGDFIFDSNYYQNKGWLLESLMSLKTAHSIPITTSAM